jgi:hypothetical protein
MRRLAPDLHCADTAMVLLLQSFLLCAAVVTSNDSVAGLHHKELATQV